MDGSGTTCGSAAPRCVPEAGSALDQPGCQRRRGGFTMVAMALDLNFQAGRKVRLREHEHSDPISLFPGLSSHRLAINLESELRGGVEPDTFPVVLLTGEAYVINHRQLDRWLGQLSTTPLILRSVDFAEMVSDLVVIVDDATVLALDELVDGQDFTLRLKLRADMTADTGANYPEANGELHVRVSTGVWQRQIKGPAAHRLVTGRIPIPSGKGALAEAGRHLREASEQLLSGQWIDAVRLTRLAQEAMKKSSELPAPNFKVALDDRTLGEKYANTLRGVFELASVPQHTGVAQRQPLDRSDAYSIFWMTAALYYHLTYGALP